MIHYTTLSVNFEDSFAKSLLHEISSFYPCDAFYYDAVRLDGILNVALHHDLVVIMIRDQFKFKNDFNYWGDNNNLTFNLIKDLSAKHANKLFVILTELETKKTLNLDNVFFINFGGKVVDDKDYVSINKFEKNFNSKKIGICLNRQMRPQRIGLISLLYGLKLDNNIHISAMHLNKQFNKIDSNNVLDHLSWKFDTSHEFIKGIIQNGFEKIYLKRNQFQINEIYEMDDDRIKNLNNPNNFNNNLINLYANSFVEIISETWYCEPYIFLTEKFQNSVYGRNFPIIIASVGYVENLRKIGFDVFDDIIDHSYDTIKNPIDRMQSAIIKNKHLFLKKDESIGLWKNNEHRFDKNIEFAKKYMYTFFHDRVIMEYKKRLDMES